MLRRVGSERAENVSMHKSYKIYHIKSILN
jgi:hypothetical protein